MIRRILLVALVLLAACSKSHDEPELFCGLFGAARNADPSMGMNPLLGDSRYLCYGSRQDCTRAHTACRPSGPPRWHCYRGGHGKGAGPIDDTECFPSHEMCESTRASRPSDAAPSSPCAAASTVSCLEAGGGSIGCVPDLATCEKYAAILPAANGANTCTPRRSVPP